MTVEGKTVVFSSQKVFKKSAFLQIKKFFHTYSLIFMDGNFNILNRRTVKMKQYNSQHESCVLMQFLKI